MTDDLRHTALTGEHQAAGARLVPFAGWLMPIQFAGTVAEHEAVRSHAGVFDVSHLGTVWVEGEGALDAVQATFTNDAATLDDGASQYTLCCDERGGIVDDLIVYRISADRLLTVPNAANTTAVTAALEEAALGTRARVADESTQWAILAVQGPDSFRVLDAALAAIGAEAPAAGAIGYLGIAAVRLDGDTEAFLARTGYTGEAGAELVVPNASAAGLWQALVDAGAVPCGLGARDTLRLEMGYPLHGNDLSVDVSPYEARLGWAVKLDRGAFRGQNALRAAKGAGPSRRLWGLRGEGRRPPRQGMAVDRDGATVGTVTSGSFSPTLGIGIGMAYLDEASDAGDRVSVDVRGTPVPFEVVRPPFVDRDPRA